MKENDRPQYITQLNAFHRWLYTNYLPPNARLLWFMMIGLFNTGGWPQQVQIDTLRLMQLVGTQSDKTALRARQSLIDAGLLEYEKGCKAQPGRYRLVWFTDANTAELRTADQAEYDGENESKNESRNEHKNDCRKARETDGEYAGENDGENDGETSEDTTLQYTFNTRKDKDIDEKRPNQTVVPASLAPMFGAYADF